MRPTSTCTVGAWRSSSCSECAGMVAFRGIDALIDQIGDDVRRVREALT